MTVHLPEDLERFVRSQVQGGRFASEDELIMEAVRLLQQASTPAGTPVTPLSEVDFERQLVRAGLLAASPGGGPAPRRDFQPIVIKGEPLSQTVIRERR